MKPTLFLNNLSIQNFATFENQSLTLHPNFTCLVGETGSGKSLVFDSIQLLLGSRSDKKQIRKGKDFCTIEGAFSCANPSVKSYLDKIGYPTSSDEIVIKRIIYNTGSSKTFLNFQACSLGVIQEFTNSYVDIVGQFENQRLLSSSYQLEILDQYLKITKEVKQYTEEFQQYQIDKGELQKLIFKLNELKKKEEFLNYQINELETLELLPDEEQILLYKKNDLLNQEKHTLLIEESLNLISESETFNIIKSLKKISTNINHFKLTQDYNSMTAEFISNLNDLSYELSKLNENGESAQGKLIEVIDRLDLILKIKRKHGGGLENILATLDNYKNELKQIKTFEIEIKSKNVSAEVQLKKIKSLAQVLHDKRVYGAKKLSKELTEKVQSLRMNGAEIDLKITTQDKLTTTGQSEANIFAKTNKGENSYLLKDIASGGELSRILLGLREIISSHDAVTVFLFDEIDTGLGGETALAIGEAIKRVSTTSQVIAITHLPQIAAYANQLAVVHKEIIDNKEDSERTISIITSYKDNDRNRILKSMNPLPN